MSEIKTKEVILKVGQQQALDKMLEWFADKDKNFTFTLEGSAGTGKSFLTKMFLEKSNTKFTAAVTAPTHKAKKVIANHTGCTSITVQSLLGLRPNFDIDNFDINELQFDPQGENQMRYYKLVIVDEASMLNTDLFDYIVSTAANNKCKVLFLGDRLQLPPVNETESKAFEHVDDKFILTEIVRQKDTNPINELLLIVRDDIANNTNNFRKYLLENPIQVNELGEGYEVIKNHIEFGEKAATYFRSQEFLDNPDYCRYTAWTNVSVEGFNKHIRKSLGIDSFISKGELLMGYNTVDSGQRYAPPLITNSEDYIVKECVETINNWAIRVYEVTLTMVATGEENVIFIVNQEDYKKYITNHEQRLAYALLHKRKAWVPYFDFCRNNILMTDAKRGDKLIKKKDLDYGYAITTHKTQGSTYENMFINGDNLDKNNDKVECKQLWYVALSRCSKKSYILYSQIS